MLWLTGPHLNWVVLVSFTPFLYPGLYSLFSFGIKILLTLTLGSCNYFLPENPVFQMMAWSVRILRGYSLMFSRELVPIAFAISLPPSTTMDDYIQMSFIPSFPIALVLRDAVNCLIGDPCVIGCHGFRKFFKLLFDLSESQVAYCSWPFSPACIMVQSIMYSRNH